MLVDAGGKAVLEMWRGQKQQWGYREEKPWERWGLVGGFASDLTEGCPQP